MGVATVLEGGCCAMAGSRGGEGGGVVGGSVERGDWRFIATARQSDRMALAWDGFYQLCGFNAHFAALPVDAAAVPGILSCTCTPRLPTPILEPLRPPPGRVWSPTSAARTSASRSSRI